MRRVSPVGAVLIGLLGLTVVGCSGNKRKITGSVTLDGQPVADARVEFLLQSSKDAPVANVRTDQQGNFEVPPRPKGGGPGLPPGQYVVLIRKLVDKATGNVPAESDNPAEDYGQLEAAGKLVNKLPAKYSNPPFPLLTVEVKADTKTLPPFELKSK
jgi:hypothetical protein